MTMQGGEGGNTHTSGVGHAKHVRNLLRSNKSIRRQFSGHHSSSFEEKNFSFALMADLHVLDKLDFPLIEK